MDASLPGSPRIDSLVVLIHGLGSCGRAWSEDEDYTKGACLTRRLTQLGIPWVAPDLYGHGEWRADEPEFDANHIPDSLWQKFVDASVQHLAETVRRESLRTGSQRITLLSYSMGSAILAKLAQEDLGLPVSDIVMAVPVPFRDMDDEYSLHNNQRAFSGRSCHIYGGEMDEEVALSELRWWYEQLEAQKKTLRIYSSGHALPVAWVNDVFDDLKLG